MKVTTLTHKSLWGRIEYKWIVLSVTTIGALMAAIDGTIVILGLPEMMVQLHADLIEMVWVIIAYIFVSTVFLLTFGRVADLFGRVRMYNLGFVVFTIGSALCGLSNTAAQLILFRPVQGSGAAMMVVNSVALITEAFPPKRWPRPLTQVIRWLDNSSAKWRRLSPPGSPAWSTPLTPAALSWAAA